MFSFLDDPPLRLKSIKIDGLFGIQNEELVFPDANQAILIGPNGCGKTTILKLLDAVINGANSSFSDLLFENPVFKKLKLTFSSTDGSYIKITYFCHHKPKTKKPSLSSVLFESSYFSSKRFNSSLNRRLADYARILSLRSLDDKMPLTAYFIPSNRVFDDDTRRAFTAVFQSLIEVSSLNQEDQKFMNQKYQASFGGARMSSEFDGAVVEANQNIESCLKRAFPTEVETSRNGPLLLAFIFSKKDPFSKEIFSLFVSKAERAHLFSKKVASFLDNCLSIWDDEIWSTILENPDTAKEARMVIRGAHVKNDALNFSTSEAVHRLISESDAASGFFCRRIADYVLLLWRLCDGFTSLKDTFDNVFTNKINLELLYEYGHGFKIRRKADKCLFELDDLSSGQLNTLILFYRLLMSDSSQNERVPRLFLIDEPEISLHILWQTAFVSQIKKLTQGANTQIIIATHSPFISSGHRDLVIHFSETIQKNTHATRK